MVSRNSIIINLIIVIALISFKGLAQEINNGEQNKINLQSTDAYLIKLQVDSVYFKKKFKIRSVFGNQSYKVCKIKIKEIYYMGDSSSVNNKELWNADFMLYKDNIIILNDTTINASLFASSLQNVYFLGRFLSEEDLSASEYNYHAIITNVVIKKRKLCKFLLENR